MPRKRFIARADDLGSSISANRAIKAVCQAGIMKNASVMAPSPYVEDAAETMAGRKDVCFGMHITLNAEWDNIKWKPLTALKPESGLVDESGFFLNDPKLFLITKPYVDTIMLEVAAQLDRLCRLGFDIKYIDSHMFPEMCVEGLDEAIQAFAVKKGLLDHMYFYAFPPGYRDVMESPALLPDFLQSLPEGQYFLVAHPAFYGEDMLLTGNANISGEMIAKERAAEAELYSSEMLRLLFQQYDCEGIRYDEAAIGNRMSVSEILEMLG